MHRSDTEYRILTILEENPHLTQREISKRMGLSLGKTNYIIRALIDRGFLKLNNFKHSDNKMSYIYTLTPAWLTEKSTLAANFLTRKQLEYDKLKKEIEMLKKELNQ